MKRYKQFCSVARALDVVGDRWALLVVRELLLGPRRYSDLLEGLPGIGTNVLSTRLRELQAAGIVALRRTPKPTPATVYELTADGRDLRSVLDALVRWGARRLTAPESDDILDPRWFVSSLPALIDGKTLVEGAPYRLDVDGVAFTLDVRGGDIAASHGPPPAATATLKGTLRDFFNASRGDKTAARRLLVAGDVRAGNKLIAAMTGAASRT